MIRQLGIERALLQVFQHGVGEAGPSQLHHRGVHPYPQARAVAGHRLCQIVDRLAQYTRSEGDDLVRALGHRDELVRRDPAEHVIVPAGERLDADDQPGAEVHDRLVVRHDCAGIYGCAQPPLDEQVASVSRGDRAVVQLDSVTAGSLGSAQRHPASGQPEKDVGACCSGVR
jgi:hypothetical protein